MTVHITGSSASNDDKSGCAPSLFKSLDPPLIAMQQITERLNLRSYTHGRFKLTIKIILARRAGKIEPT